MKCRDCDIRMKKVIIPKRVRIKVDANKNDLYVCPTCELLAELDKDMPRDEEVHWFNRQKVVHEVDPYIVKTLQSGWKTSW